MKFEGLKEKSYNVIYADPPWNYYGDPNKDQAAGKHYSLMSDQDIRNLPVRNLIASAGVLFLWATCPRLDLAIDVLMDWGFYYRGVAYVWVKTTKSGKIIGGQGVRPSFVKPTTELVLIGSTTKKGRTLPIHTEAQSQVVLAPRGRHSEKPPEVRARIEQLMGNVPKCELFARQRFEGWDCWGNELPPA